MLGGSVITRHRAKDLQNFSKGVWLHLNHPGKRLINDDGRQKSSEDNDRQHARHQHLRPEVLASEEKSVSDRYESASEQDRPYTPGTSPSAAESLARRI
jgi:hypothetical protein